MQLALPTGRMAKARNRQIKEKTLQHKIHPLPGRPAKAVKSPHAVTHQARPRLGKKEVLHLTLKLRRGLPSLRRAKAFAAIQRSFYKYSRGDGFRLVQFGVQKDHLHLIAEADSKTALSKAMQKLAISLAKRLDWLWSKMTASKIGRIFKERYHQHVLKTAQEARNALVYVIQNAKKHGEIRAHERDFYSSARFFDGFTNAKPQPLPDKLLSRATAWLLTTAWRQKGLIPVSEVPRS